MNDEFERVRRNFEIFRHEASHLERAMRRRESDQALVERSMRRIDESFRLIAYANSVLDLSPGAGRRTEETESGATQAATKGRTGAETDGARTAGA